MSEERIFITDDDGHWYLIVPDDKDTFTDLIDRHEYDEVDRMFGAYRCYHPTNYKVKVVDYDT